MKEETIRFAGILEDVNGVPQTNPIYIPDADNILYILQNKRKLCLVGTFTKDYMYRRVLKEYNTIEEFEENAFYFPDPPILYTYEDIRQMAEGIDIVTYKNLIFKRENIKYAYAMYCLGGCPKEKSEESDIYHTMVGILLSYDKRDICAWLTCTILSYKPFLDKFSHIESNEELGKNIEYIEVYRQHKERFETIWKIANDRLVQLFEQEVPEEWKSQVTPLFTDHSNDS